MLHSTILRLGYNNFLQNINNIYNFFPEITTVYKYISERIYQRKYFV